MIFLVVFYHSIIFVEKATRGSSVCFFLVFQGLSHFPLMNKAITESAIGWFCTELTVLDSNTGFVRKKRWNTGENTCLTPMPYYSCVFYCVISKEYSVPGCRYMLGRCTEQLDSSRGEGSNDQRLTECLRIISYQKYTCTKYKRGCGRRLQKHFLP